jgi:hypothetical protein
MFVLLSCTELGVRKGGKGYGLMVGVWLVSFGIGVTKQKKDVDAFKPFTK